MIKELLKISISILWTISVGLSYSQDSSKLVYLDSLNLDDMHALGYYNYDVPDNVYVSNYQGNVGDKNGQDILKDDLYSIGWSQDGYYAYAIEPDLENSNNYIVEFYIADIKKDSIVWFMTYDNSEWRETFKKSEGDIRDSLLNEHRCYYLRCTWMTFYDTISKSLFEYNIIPDQLNPYLHYNDILSDQKFNSIVPDEDDSSHLDLKLFFEYDTDTISKKLSLKDGAIGINYHGYLPHPDSSEWGVMLLSMQYPGLDSATEQSWHYFLKGFKRSKELPFKQNNIEIPSTRFSTHKEPVEYRKVELIEKMYDRVTNMDEEDWLKKYGRYRLADYYDKNDYVFPEGYGEAEFLTSLYTDEKTYYLDRSFTLPDYKFYVYGLKQNDSIQNAYQLVSIKRENDSVVVWSEMNDVNALDGSVEYVSMEDSIAYISISSLIDGGEYGHLIALDMTTLKILWRSADNISNAHSFQLFNDVLVSGYGDESRQKICVINKLDGSLIKEITMPSKPLWINRVGDKILVKTETSTHEFSLKSSFFKSYE